MTSITGPNADRIKGRHGRAGFTLLELILVMLIICTVLAMAAPSLRGFFASRRAVDAAARIVALTRLARTQAASEGRLYRLHIDPVERTYWMTVQQGGAFGRPANEFGRVFALPEDTRAVWSEPPLGETPGVVNFYPDGSTDPVVLRLEGAQGDTVDVFCPSATEQFEAAIGPRRDG